MLIFEHCPNLRIHLSGERSLTSPHTDREHQHSEAEINWWVPLTPCSGSASLWAESAPGLGDFHAFEVQPGEAVRFYGNQCLHFTRDNSSSQSRVSFDFRVIRLRDFHWAKVPAPTEKDAEVRWSIFAYYDVMAADGTVLTGLEDWERYVAPVLANQKTPLNEFPSMVSLGDHPDHPPPAAPTATRRSRRSTSPEHVARCAERLGSQRLARRQCARCGWIAHRARLLEVLRFSKPHEPHGVATSETAPWDPSLPWGLGCRLCARRVRLGARGVPPGGRRTAFSDFTFGASMPGLLFQPLLRHGNHAMRQVAMRRESTPLVVEQDFETLGGLCVVWWMGVHAEAQRAVLAGLLILDDSDSCEDAEKREGIATKIDLYTALPTGGEASYEAVSFKRPTGACECGSGLRALLPNHQRTLGYLSLDSNERSQFQARELKSVESLDQSRSEHGVYVDAGVLGTFGDGHLVEWQRHLSEASRLLRVSSPLRVRRQQRLEVLVMTPSEKAMGYPPSAGAEAVCRALGCSSQRGYSHEVASNNEALLAAVQRFQPDLLVSILWPRRVPKEVLDLCALVEEPRGPESLNFHPSLLPKHRGSLTQFWAIFEGDDKAGTTCHRMVLEFDAGKILHREEVELSADEQLGPTALSLSHKIALTTEKCASPRLLDDMLDCFKHIMELYFTMGLPEGEDWDIAEFPYHYRRLHEDRNSSVHVARTSDDGFIDPTWPDEKVDRFIRATYFPPYAAARLRRADGAIDGVVSLKAYQDGQGLGDELLWHKSGVLQALRAADEGVAQLELFARAAAFFERHGPGSSVRRLWDRKCEEAIEYWKERPQGTDVIAEAQEAQKAVAPALARAVCAAAALGVPPEEEVEEDVFEGALAVLQHKKVETVGFGPSLAANCCPSAAEPSAADNDLASIVATSHLGGVGARGDLEKVAIIASLLDNVDESRSLARRVPVEGGRCMDGSTSNLYLAKGYENVGHPDLCSERARGYHGSSHDDAEFRDFAKRGNRVMVRNCDGTLFLSDSELETELQGNRSTLQLRGRSNAFKALQQLLPLGLLDASELLLGGCSAGAVAALQLGDQLAELVRRAQRAQRGAQTAAEEVFVAILWPGDVDPCQSVACACLCRHMFWYAMCLGER
ncbi:unnamed protein product [Durusdinium trenchii]|uniref:Formyl transferase N-terminal domain-containing protein n=1 Tax=Durusdinium trenchii TaxID=1381693 RepID=A0ABP0MC70_9DINO